MAVTLTCNGATHSPFYFHFCWQLWAHPWTVIICCSASLCSVSLAEARSGVLTQTLNFSQLLFFYHFFTASPSLHHSFIPTLLLCVSSLCLCCVGVDLKWRRQAESRRVQTHEKDTRYNKMWLYKHAAIQPLHQTYVRYIRRSQIRRWSLTSHPISADLYAADSYFHSPAQGGAAKITNCPRNRDSSQALLYTYHILTTCSSDTFFFTFAFIGLSLNRLPGELYLRLGYVIPLPSREYFGLTGSPLCLLLHSLRGKQNRQKYNNNSERGKKW